MAPIALTTNLKDFVSLPFECPILTHDSWMWSELITVELSKELTCFT
jgi:hypothetical protein